MTFELVLVGFGHVAQRFVTLLEQQRSSLAETYGIETIIVGVATRRHGRTASPRGVDTDALMEKNASATVVPGTPPSPASTKKFVAEIAARTTAAAEGRLVVVETTTLDVTCGQPAIDHALGALECGAHVVTANKGPVAFAYDTLAAAASRAGRRFLFEGAVMDGIPIFNLVRETLPAVQVVGFRGVVNSTTNYILTAMEEGQGFEEALSDMRAAGIAEADASLDVDGWDAAAKTAALANVLLAARLTPHTVERRGISADSGRDAAEARSRGRRLKLVARASRENGRVTARVSPEALAEDDLLAGLEGQQNALVLHTDLLGELAIVQLGGGLTQTAYALLSDLITIARGDSGRARPGRP